MSRNLGIVLAALCVALGLGSTAHASTNLLLNVPWSSNVDGLGGGDGTGYFNVGVNNVTNEKLDYTDGSTATFAFQKYQSIVTYDLGSVINGLHIVGIATNDTHAENEDNPTFITLNFSNDNFANTIATRTISLADTNLEQDVSFSSVNARYVQFVMPSSSNFYNDGNNNAYILPEELELFGPSPEPASLGLLVIGGGVLLGKRRRRAA